MNKPSLRRDDLLIPQGSTFRIQWPITDAEGQPIPLAGYTARSQFRERVSSTAVLAEFTTENNRITLAESTITLEIPADESSAWTWRSATYDLELVSDGGEPTRITQGTVTLDAEVTR